MVAAEFEEKEYELQFNLELAAGSIGIVWAAGQVLEGIVAYDGVADPDVHHVVWTVLHLPRPPGIVLAPGHWGTGARPAAGDLSAQPVSLVLQYKRPDFLFGARAAQWRLWGEPYYRFKRSASQHRILVQLERSLGASAVVRYAAPAFWQRGELQAHAMRRTVISESGFVSPLALGTHRVWTYREPGVEGKGNPSGRGAAFESAEEIAELLSSASPASPALPVVPSEATPTAIARAAEVAGYRRPWLRNGLASFEEEILSADLPLSIGATRSILGVAAMSSLTWSVGATWRLVRRG